MSFAPAQASRGCFQTDSTKELERLRESACFTDEYEKPVKITYIDYRDYTSILYTARFLEFEYCIDGECEKIVLNNEEAAYIAKIKISGDDGQYLIKNLYIGANYYKLVFKLKPD
jgi:hypothetical protein